jgi:hypothetical protein
VIEWLGEVIPPQAKIAKEQQSHLARQIAADRFNLQYAEASTNWYQSGELKFAGLRIRITHAQARLGVPGSLIGGLTADAIEGIEVPAYQSPVDLSEGEAPAEPTPARSASEGIGSKHTFRSQQLATAVGRGSPDPAHPSPTVGRGSPDPAHSPTAGLPDNPTGGTSKPRKHTKQELAALRKEYPWLFWILGLKEITPEMIAIAEAVGLPFEPRVIQALYDQGFLPRAAAEAAKPASIPAPDDQLPTSTTNPQSEIRNPHSSPPPGDFSAVGCVESVPADETHHAPAETPMPVSTCDYDDDEPIAPQQSANTTSQPLLTSRNGCPVTELEINPNQSGASVSQTMPTSSDHPRSPSPPRPTVHADR